MLTPVHIDIQPVRDELDRLYEAARSNSVHELMESLKRLVPEFKPTYSFIGEAPLTFQRVRPDLFPSPFRLCQSTAAEEVKYLKGLGYNPKSFY